MGWDFIVMGGGTAPKQSKVQFNPLTNSSAVSLREGRAALSPRYLSRLTSSPTSVYLVSKRGIGPSYPRNVLLIEYNSRPSPSPQAPGSFIGLTLTSVIRSTL